jgi:protein ImuA
MRANNENKLIKTSASELRDLLRRQGLPVILGRSVAREDDPEVNPARLAMPGLHDIAGELQADYAAALAFALASAHRTAKKSGRQALICQMANSAFDHGALYGPGLNSLGIDPGAFAIVSTRSESDLLWCAEEALGCGEIAALVLRLPSRARKYSFTASRRLQLRALESGAPAYVVRGTPERGAIAAETLWRIAPAASLPSGYASKRILGLARWRAALERARTSRPKDWVVAWENETLRIDMAEPVGDGPLLSRAS